MVKAQVVWKVALCPWVTSSKEGCLNLEVKTLPVLEKFPPTRHRRLESTTAPLWES